MSTSEIFTYAVLTKGDDGRMVLEIIEPHKDEHPTGRFCNKCGTEVLTEEELDHYPYYCPHCNENMFEIETHQKGN